MFTFFYRDHMYHCTSTEITSIKIPARFYVKIMYKTYKPGLCILNHWNE